MVRWLIVLPAALLIVGATVTVWNLTADGKPTNPGPHTVPGKDVQAFSPAAWLGAKKERNWSRQKLMEQFCTQYRNQLDQKKLDKAKILTFLGQPEMSYEYPKAKNSNKSGQIPSEVTDHYQLSEKKGTFEITYDEHGIVSAYSQSSAPCIFEDYIGAAQSNNLAKATLENGKKASKFDSIVQIEQLLGPPAKSVVDTRPNFPTPYRLSSYFWNLSLDRHKILWVRTSGRSNEALDKRSVDVVCIITLSPDCPVKQ